MVYWVIKKSKPESMLYNVENVQFYYFTLQKLFQEFNLISELVFLEL